MVPGQSGIIEMTAEAKSDCKYFEALKEGDRAISPYRLPAD